MTITLAYDPQTRTTYVDGVQCPEPDGMEGVARTARFYLLLGNSVTVGRVRQNSRPAGKTALTASA